MSALHLEPYSAQLARWPARGQHILAQFDERTIVVYQAYRHSIGEAAIRRQRLGEGGFSFDRMSWVKPNFLWMMYRSGWGTKEGQEVTLGIRVLRLGFDSLLAEAVPSTWDRARYPSREAWADAVAASEVRLQWDPDHDPQGGRCERRAIQLGLRGTALRRFAEELTVEILDLRELVEEGREKRGSPEQLRTPREEVYPTPGPVAHSG